MARMRGKMRQFVLLVALGAGVIVLLLFTYRKTSAPVVVRDDDGVGGGGSSMDATFSDDSNINAVGLTQAEDDLKRMRQHERLMLDNFKNLIRHQEPTPSTDGDPTRPSVWSPGLSRSGLEPLSHPQSNDIVLGMRYVHLDLKGARPTMKYMRRLLPFLRGLGATGLLIEYEDTFPYWGRLDDFRARDSYTAQDITELNRLAADNALEVVPLVQTFGHMEFVLKRDGFKSLREIPTLPQAICPTHNDTLILVREMIDQLVALHPNARRLHIGCDEVYNVGECPLCQERMDRLRWTTEDLLVSHVKAVARHVHDAHRLRAIVWDDMFRKVSLDAIRQSDIGRYADVLVWQYHDNIDEAMPADVWTKYADVFEGIWIASAFKGAAQPNTFATDVGVRLSNHMHWMDVVRKYAGRVSFAGIFITGWQRYDHFSVLCELLPAGIPSLAVNLRYLQSLNWSTDDEERVRLSLGCNLPVPLQLIVNGSPEMRCNFPGSRVFELALQFHTIIANLNSEFFESNYVLGWVSDYNMQTRFSSPALLQQAVLRYADAQRNLTYFAMSMEGALTEVYDRPTVVEWLDTFVKPLVARLERYHEKMKWLLVPNVWPRRPIESVSTERPMFELTAVAVTPSRQQQHAMEP